MPRLAPAGLAQATCLRKRCVMALFEIAGIEAADDVLLHFNAEGGEFLAIPPAVADGSLCHFVDHLSIDLHYTYFRGAKSKNVFSREQLARWVNSSTACPHMKTLTVW